MSVVPTRGEGNPELNGDAQPVELSTSDEAQLHFRQELERLFVETPLPRKDLLFHLGLYARSSLLVKFLVMNDLYERIKDIPGALCEFGVYWGQNLILLENLRAIHEPFNKQRTVIGFDSFGGYQRFAPEDRDATALAGTYTVPDTYRRYLEELLETHEGMNAFGHVRGRHKVIEGDAAVTVPTYFQERPETIVALAYFDIGLYEPTRAILEAIRPHLVPGSVLLFDELTWQGAPGEARAFKEAFAGTDFRIEKSRFYPSKAIVTVGQI